MNTIHPIFPIFVCKWLMRTSKSYTAVSMHLLSRVQKGDAGETRILRVRNSAAQGMSWSNCLSETCLSTLWAYNRMALVADTVCDVAFNSRDAHPNHNHYFLCLHNDLRRVWRAVAFLSGVGVGGARRTKATCKIQLCTSGDFYCTSIYTWI